MSNDADLRERMLTVEREITEIKVSAAKMEAAQAETSRVVGDVKRDTEDIVLLLKGGKVAGRMGAWGVGVAIAGSSIYAGFLAFKHWLRS